MVTSPNAPGSPRHFVCSASGEGQAQGESEYACFACGPSGILESASLPAAAYEGEPFTRSPGVWRYERLLCLSLDAPRPPLLVGATPLLHAQRLGQTLGLPHLSIKNDSLNPTGSLKDRASAVALARAAKVGAKRLAVALAGNASSPLARKVVPGTETLHRSKNVKTVVIHS